MWTSILATIKSFGKLLKKGTRLTGNKLIPKNNIIIDTLTKPKKFISAKASSFKKLAKSPVKTTKKYVKQKTIRSFKNVLNEQFDFSNININKFRSLISFNISFIDEMNNFKIKNVESTFVQSIGWVPSLKSYAKECYNNGNDLKKGQQLNIDFTELKGFMVTIFNNDKKRVTELHRDIEYFKFFEYLNSLSKGSYFNEQIDTIKPMLTGDKALYSFERFRQDLLDFQDKLNEQTHL